MRRKAGDLRRKARGLDYEVNLYGGQADAFVDYCFPVCWCSKSCAFDRTNAKTYVRM